jgi:hypothetical protein
VQPEYGWRVPFGARCEITSYRGGGVHPSIGLADFELSSFVRFLMLFEQGQIRVRTSFIDLSSARAPFACVFEIVRTLLAGRVTSVFFSGRIGSCAVLSDGVDWDVHTCDIFQVQVHLERMVSSVGTS